MLGDIENESNISKFVQYGHQCWATLESIEIERFGYVEDQHIPFSGMDGLSYRLRLLYWFLVNRESNTGPNSGTELLSSNTNYPAGIKLLCNIDSQRVHSREQDHGGPTENMNVCTPYNTRAIARAPVGMAQGTNRGDYYFDTNRSNWPTNRSNWPTRMNYWKLSEKYVPGLIWHTFGNIWSGKLSEMGYFDQTKYLAGIKIFESQRSEIAQGQRDLTS